MESHRETTERDKERKKRKQTSYLLPHLSTSHCRASPVFAMCSSMNTPLVSLSTPVNTTIEYLQVPPPRAPSCSSAALLWISVKGCVMDTTSRMAWGPGGQRMAPMHGPSLSRLGGGCGGVSDSAPALSLLLSASGWSSGSLGMAHGGVSTTVTRRPKISVWPTLLWVVSAPESKTSSPRMVLAVEVLPDRGPPRISSLRSGGCRPLGSPVERQKD